MTPKKNRKKALFRSTIDPHDLNLIYNCDIISLNRDQSFRDGEAPLCLEGMEVFSPIKRKRTIEHLYSPIKVSNEKVEKASEEAEAREISCNQVKVQESEKEIHPNEAKQNGRTFSIEVFKHLCITEFRESDHGGRWKKIEQSQSQSLGLSCRYCDGESGKERRKMWSLFSYFLQNIQKSKQDTFSVYRRLKRCQQCPIEVVRYFLLCL